jgi:hypothetical protein
MKAKIDIPLESTLPTAEEVLRAQGVPKSVDPGRRSLGLATEAVETYRHLAVPVGLLSEVDDDEFGRIYRGEGNNDDQTALDDILPQSVNLAVFAVTLGVPICDEISRLMKSGDFAEGAILDSAASLGAEKAADFVEAYREAYLDEHSRLTKSEGVLQFSPGYCGWHVSGQKRLFAYLTPSEIGISLTDSCLMQPLKSISGVLVAGPIEIFDFKDDFPFCEPCKNHSCRSRYKALAARRA